MDKDDGSERKSGKRDVGVVRGRRTGEEQGRGGKGERRRGRMGTRTKEEGTGKMKGEL